MGASFIVGITGGSGAGKTFFIHQLVKEFPANKICQISQDNYYKNIAEVPVDENGIKNFDLPEAVDFKTFIHDIQKLEEGHSVERKEYTFNNSSKTPKTIFLRPAPIIIVEGIFALSMDKLQDLFDLKLFIESPEIIKIKRRIMRDAMDRGYDMEDVLYRYEHHVVPAYKRYIQPHRSNADLIIHNNHDMTKAIDIIATYLKQKLDTSVPGR